MKLTPISNEEALKIIVEGEDKAFTIFELEGKSYTIYHRKYKDKHYDVLEIMVYDEENNQEISVFRLLDKEEIRMLFRKWSK